MATWLLRRFSTPDVLNQIKQERLIAFLSPYHDFFESRGVKLTKLKSTWKNRYQSLIQAFLQPNADMPTDLINALYFVDEMATTEGMDSLLTQAERIGLKLQLGDEDTPADVAIQVWLQNRALLERMHAEHYLEHVRSFSYYRTAGDATPAHRPLTKSRLKRFINSLDAWFASRNRSQGTHVFASEHGDDHFFLIRHAEPFRREESLSGSDVSSVCYRPVRYDVVIYSSRIGELAIHARSKGEQQLYRTRMGLMLFDDDNSFPGTEKYTLDPVKSIGEPSLDCHDVEGIDQVKLREVQILRNGNPYLIETFQSDDLFEAYARRKQHFPKSGRILKAKFQLKFSGAKRPRTLTIKPPNVTLLTRESDSQVVENWLKARGFIVTT